MSCKGAVNRLQRYNRDAPAPTDETMDRAEEEEFKKLEDQAREEEERRCPSLKSIPRFYEKKVSAPDESKSLRPCVMFEARKHLLNRKSREELLDEEDLLLVRSLLEQNARGRAAGACGDNFIDYGGFARVREELAKKGERFRHFFAPSTFLKFPRDQNGCIGIQNFLNFLVRTVNIRQTRLHLGSYDVLGCGYLREKDMENFIFELIATLPQLKSLQEEFYPFYVFTAVRKFFFFLDPKRTGRLRIKDLLSSQIIFELYELKQEHPLPDHEAQNNWFSMQSALRVYGTYLQLDQDQNGMLSKSELKGYGNGMLTDVFIDRIFEEYQTYRDAETGENEMDYKTFLDFVLAMENKNSKQAIQYFWRLIDINRKGEVDGFTINYFFRSIVALLRKKKLDPVAVDDVKDEIFDMVQAKTGIITLQDLINCRQGGTVLSILTDAAAFWRYDNRESMDESLDDDDELE
eukprot:CAMPEP_0171099516 /NCGR_PEP_ID=MMETSP0766_2-20121228/51775_1 /TAXON_ID=439317 /ORGANISM="Gambierdiscus australes, Strain CAWD 149" /LENGTH=462 /DNA_ID=CAMNT_0011559161 /DNA_START=106 /DNA_END=1494 /DNA_ORIENTATION=-